MNPTPPGADPGTAPPPPPPPPVPPGRQAWQRLAAHRGARVAGAFLLAILLLALAGPWAWPVDGNAGSDLPFAPPGPGHWFGTDIHGRDVLARVIAGTRLSLLVGLVGAGVSLGIGVAWGLVAAYAGGRVDGLMMRAVDVLYALPNIVFVMLAMTLVEPPLTRWLAGWAPGAVPVGRLLLLFACLGAVSWLNMARLVRGQVLVLRQSAYVQASRVLGAGPAWILRRHLLPNVAGVILAYLALSVPAVILYESFLSFLGLGIRPPDASLGVLIADGAQQLNPLRVRWWLLVFPAGTLASILLALGVFGDGLRDAWDPRSGSARV